MDAAQILMMPMASTATVTTLSPDPGAAQTSGELSARFSDLLAQTVATQAVAQQIPELDAVATIPVSNVVPGMEPPEQDQNPSALLVQAEDESTAALQMAALYAQLTVLQAPPLLSAQEQSVAPDVTAMADAEALSGYVKSVASDLNDTHQDTVGRNTAADEVKPRQPEEKDLAGQAATMQLRAVKAEELADEPQQQETQVPVRQAENRHQPAEQSAVSSRIAEQQPVIQQAGERRIAEQQSVIQAAGNGPIAEQQPVIQQVGSSRGQEHQQAAAQVQVVRNQGNQEVSASNKPQPANQAQAFRFAQSNEVAVAVADRGSQGLDFSGQQQSQTFEQSFVPTAGEMSEDALVESAGLVKQGLVADERQQLVLQAGARPQPAVSALTGADELPKQGQSEQVARQVFERLGAHEFKQGKDQISLRLSPEHLGNVQLNLRMEEQGLKLEIIAEQRGVRDALLRQGDELKESLARQNIRIDSFEVSTGTLGGQTQQQQREWRQMNPEQRLYHAQYASAARGGGAVQDPPPGVLYFAPQYQSTIDVRF